MANLNDTSRFGNIRKPKFLWWNCSVISKHIFSKCAFISFVLILQCLYPHTYAYTQIRKERKAYSYMFQILEEMVIVQNVFQENFTFCFNIALDQHLALLYGSSWQFLTEDHLIFLPTFTSIKIRGVKLFFGKVFPSDIYNSKPHGVYQTLICDSPSFRQTGETLPAWVYPHFLLNT